MLSHLLESRGIGCRVCKEESELTDALRAALPGALLLTQEALTGSVIEAIRQHLEAQPEWSELTVIVIVEEDAVRSGMPRRLAEFWPGSRQVFYQRPLATIELVSGVQSALLARLRQREVRDHLDLERELRHELNHRVKNILASVNSIFQMTARNSRDLDELKRSFGGRLSTLGNVHAALFDAGGEALDLERLVCLILSPYAGDGSASFTLDGPPVSLDKDATTAFGLVVHELVTNALKYGAWSVPDGEIRVTWRIDDGRFVFEWRETGGPQLSAPERQGYGTRYIRAAMEGALGEAPDVRFEPSGLVVTAAGDAHRITSGGSGDRSGPDTVGPRN